MRPSHRRHNRMWPRLSWWSPAYVTSRSLAEILKRLYVTEDEPEMAKPWFATLAYERHWITGVAWRGIPDVPTGRITRSLNSYLGEASPLFGLIKKQAAA